MSVINQVFAVPSRVFGVYRLLLQQPGRKMNRAELENVLSPQSILNMKDEMDEGGTDESSEKNLKMIHAVVNETVKMGLVHEEDDVVMLSPDLPKDMLDKNKGTDVFPFYVLDLFFSEKNPENHDFVRLLTWFLAQDAYDAPDTWSRFERALTQQVGEHKLDCTNDNRYAQFLYWSRFCGFTTMYEIDETSLVPDPTIYMKWVLPELFSEHKTLSFQESVRGLAARCPVFEEGKFRKEMAEEYRHENREERFLSSVTCHAWFRLQDEGYITLDHKSDAEVYVLVEGNRQHRFSHVTWLGKKGRV